jgi:O-antigen/teichoic acid export membrane protein
MSRFTRNVIGVFGTQVAVTAIGVCTGVLTARALGPHDRGLFALLTLLPSTLINFVKFGVPQANVYFVRRRGYPAGQVAANALVLAILLGGGLAVACYLQRDWLTATFLRGVRAPQLLPILALLPFVLTEAYFLGILQAIERFGHFNFQYLIQAVLLLVGLALALLVLRAGLTGAVLAHVVVLAGVDAWLVWRVHRVAPLRLRWDPVLTRQAVAFGGKSYVQTLASHLHFKVDQYMIAALLDPTRVGYYAIAVGMTNLILKIPDALGTVVYPELARLDERDAHTRTAVICRHTLFITAVVGCAIAIAAPLLIGVLYGGRYLPAIAPLRLMLPGVVMISLYLILTRNFTSRNRQQVNIIAASAALAINVVLNFLLIPRYGIAGAAISTTVSYSTAAVILLAVFVRESGDSVARVLVVRWADLLAYPRAVAAAGMRARTFASGRSN